MRTNPKQKVITINKTKCDRQNLYTTINLEALHLAAQTLKAGAFKLWLYFAQNQNNYSFALSNKDANDSFGIKKDQYDTAMKELADKGYLRLDHGNSWIFSDMPNLEIGKNQSQQSKGATIIQDLLETNNIKFEKEKAFKNFKYTDTGYSPYYDFYLPDYNILIEYDGEQHYKKSQWYPTAEALKKLQERDQIKTDWATTNGYKLVRIPYWEKENISLDMILN